MIKITNPEDCSGCTACASACGHDAISMEPDALGFRYPSVDTSLCVECGVCEKVCPFNENYQTADNLDSPECYGARHNDMSEIETSRSGAAFIAISDYVLDNGGIVYGAGYENHFEVTHKRAMTKLERDEFKGSKYVQSNLKDVFRKIKKDLQAGYMVLFSGTPCQTAGLDSYIGSKLRKNLILVDIVCHGVPSPYMWRDYLAYLERRHGSEICYVNFRDKQMFGWGAHKETFKFVKTGGGKMSFTFLFYKNIFARHSCNKCHFCNTRRPSDITIADFWGWEKSAPSLNRDNKGVSLVLCNTPKGKEIFEKVKKDMTVVPVELSQALQPNLVHPTKAHPKRMRFENDYIRHGFEYVYYKYGEEGWRYRLASFPQSTYRKLKRTVKKVFVKCGLVKPYR